MSGESNLPGDVQIKRIDLFSIDKNKKTSIIGQCQLINVYESILRNTIYAEIFMKDGIDLLNEFPIIAEESVEFEFVTPGFDKSTVFKLQIYAIEDMYNDAAAGSRKYVLKCCSAEMYKDSTTLVYKKYKDEAANMVQQLVSSELGSDKKMFNLEQTKGIQEILIAQKTPMQAIQHIRLRSVSSKYKSSSFVFFENKNGYNFCTIEYLFDKNKGNIGDKVFFYDSAVNQNVENINFRNILAYRNIGRTDTITKLRKGSVYNNTQYYDVISGEFKDIEYNLNTSDFKYSDDKAVGFNSSTFENKYKGKKKFKQFIPVDSSRPETFLPESRGALQSFVQQLVQNIVHIHIYGDSVITAGDVITCKLPQITNLTVAPEEDRLIAGNYMVAKLRHIFQFGARVQYSQSLELINAAFNQSP